MFKKKASNKIITEHEIDLKSYRIYKIRVSYSFSTSCTSQKTVTSPIVSSLPIFHLVPSMTRYSGQSNGQRRDRRSGWIRGRRCGCGRGKALRDARALRITAKCRCDATVDPDSKTDQTFWFSGGDAPGGAGLSLDASQ